MLYINPEECIDCRQCVAECPVEAIFHEDDVPDEWRGFIDLNAEIAAAHHFRTSAGVEIMIPKEVRNGLAEITGSTGEVPALFGRV